jgi:hypothetical protein
VRIIPILVAVAALPLMALGQANDQQQGAAQGQTNENQEKPPKKKPHAAQEMAKPSAKPQTGANMRGQTKAETRTSGGVKKAEGGPTTKTQTKVVNKEEFKTQHREVFTLGRHPKEFFVQRFGASHFRLIGNTYFVFVDGCWVAVDVAGFTFVERVICEGDPDYIVVY